MMVSANPIRVQLPGGERYAPALYEAAAKITARSNLPAKTNKAFRALVELAVSTLNRCAAATVTLEMIVHEDSITGTVIGKGCTKLTKKSVAELEAKTPKATQSFETKVAKSTLTITFDV